MAVQFASGANKLTSSGVLTGAGAANMTYSMWLRPDNTSESFAPFWAVKSGNDLGFQTNGAATGLQVYNNLSSTSNHDVITMSSGTWYYIAYVVNGTTINTYTATLGDSSLTVESSNTSSSTTPSYDLMGWGTFPYYGGAKSCSIAYYREWAAALSQAELESEMDATTAVRTSNLNREMRFQSGALNTDSSGLGRTITSDGGGTFVTDPTLAGGGGTAYTDSVTTTVTSTTSEIDVRAALESVTTTVTGTTSSTDTRATVESVTTTVASTTSSTDVLTAFDSISDTINATTSISEVYTPGAGGGTAYSDSVETTISSTTSVTDSVAITEPFIVTTAVGETSASSIQASFESLVDSINASTESTDIAGFREYPTAVITALTGVTDVLSMYDELTTNINATTTSIDIKTYVADISDLMVGDTTGSTNRADFKDTLLTLINATTTTTDILNGIIPPVEGSLIYQVGPFKVMGKI